ncbi:hypothetical protein ACPFP2_09475 [Micromonospora citrea]|uniref:hypothetical protein n=1 Tax=Micromonospora citrea TaxID=47855 RepID=UPI003C41B701
MDKKHGTSYPLRGIAFGMALIGVILFICAGNLDYGLLGMKFPLNAMAVILMSGSIVFWALHALAAILREYTRS